MGKVPFGRGKAAFCSTFIVTKRTSEYKQEVYIQWKAGRRGEKEGRQHLRVKSVGEAAADIGEHAADFRPYPSTIDHADKILRLRTRKAVGGEEARDRTNSVN